MAPYGSIRILDPSHLLPPDADGTIRVAPHPAYENAVLALLHSIVGSHVGRVVINAIARKHGWDSMLIVPHGRGDHENKAIMLDSQGGRHKGEVDHWTDNNNKRHHVNGTGAGSSAVIHFSPHNSNHGQSCHAAGSQADEILIHEAFHGLRQLLGMMHKRPVGDKYDDEEEFFAKLIENIYISEKYPHRHLRAIITATRCSTYRGRIRSLIMQLTFQRRSCTHGNRKLVEKLIGQQPSLCGHVALGKGKFNHIRVLLIENATLN